jgi:ankyrin repeat protein
MALSSGSTSQARLLELALDQGLSLEGLPAKLSALSVSPSFASRSDISQATQILERHKSTKTHGKPFLRTKSRIANYNFKVSTEALKEVVKQNGSAGVAEALVDLGGNIGSVQRTERIAQQDAERSALLMTAAAKSNTDLVRLLAPKTTQCGRNDALKQAVSARNLDIMQILLEYGADPNHCENSFGRACLAGDEDLVSLFLRAPAPRPLLNSTITVNLLSAVNSGSVRTVSLLALSGADCSHGQAAALHRAIELLQPRFVLAIILGVVKPSQQLLDAAVSAAYNVSEAATQVKKIFIETLLCAGAQGNETAAVLVHCVKRCEINLVNLLVGHGTSTNFNNGQAVSAAVKGGRLDVLRLLLGNGLLAGHHASRAFSEIPLPLERDTRYDMMKALINAGACGPPLHEELIRAVTESDDRLIDLLLLGQASVDYQDGAALRIAVQKEQIGLVSKLMSKNPDENSLRKVFPSIRTCSTKFGRLQLTQIFLRAGIKGKAVDVGLRDAIRDQSDLRDNALINLLSKGGADANFNQGEGLAFSVDRGDIEIVQSLLLGLTDLSTISAQIPRAMNVRPVLRRYQILVALIEKLSEQSDAPAEKVHMALVDAIEENPIDVELLGLLLGKGRADINYDSGEALRKALKQADISVVEAMLKLPDGFPPSVLRLETISSALSTVIDLPSSNLQRLPKLRAIVRKGSERNTLSDTLSKALIWEIERHTVNAVSESWPSADVLGILLKAGADVNDDSGRSIVLATEAAALPILKILLKHEPKSSVVDAAMSRIVRLTKPDDQLSCSRALLEIGVSDKVIDQVLIEVAGKGSTSLQMTQQLLDFGAFPGYVNGASIKAAANARDLITLRTLLDAKQSPRHLKAVADRQNGINGSLILGAFSSDLGVCKLLLKHGASVNYGGSVAAKKTTQAGNAKLLQLLLTAEPSSDTLGICFNAARRLNHDQQYPVLEQILKAGMTGSSVDSNLINGYLIDLVESSDVSKALISLLVDFNASVHYENHRSMRFAILRSSFEIFSIILKAATERSSFTYCFGEGMRDEIWRSPLGLDKLSLLLDKGACGDPVNEALVESVRASGKESNSILFVDLLLQHNADVDYKNGLALRLACGIGDLSLISKLLTHSPAGYIKFLSIAELLNTPLFCRWPECVTVSVINEIMQSPGDHPELDTSHPDHGSILKLSLSRRPEGAKILETLIGYGASVEGVPQISNSNVSDIESSSLLFWALSEPNIEIPIDCISLIVNAGGMSS